MVEANEDPWEAAAREFQEETGPTEYSTPFGNRYIETEPYGKGKVARYYIVQVEGDKEVTLIANPVTGIVEHHDFRWVSYEEACGMVVPRVADVLEWAKKQISG